LANKEDDRVRKEFEKWAVLTYSNNRAMINEKKGKDGGIDGISLITDKENADVIKKQIIFSVKSDKKPHVSYIRDLIGVMTRENAAMGYLITLYEPTKDMIDEAKKQGIYKNKYFDMEFQKVKIITVKEILDGEILNIPRGQEVDVVKSAELKIDDSAQIKMTL